MHHSLCTKEALQECILITQIAGRDEVELIFFNSGMVYRVQSPKVTMKRLFIIDDNEDILFSLKLWFEKKGFVVAIFTLPEPLILALKSTTPGLILMDVNLEDKDGRKICKELKQNHQLNCPILLFSANPFVLKDYKMYLADGVIEKPFSLHDITGIVTSFTQAG